jgi:hypothetical protein
MPRKRDTVFALLCNGHAFDECGAARDGGGAGTFLRLSKAAIATPRIAQQRSPSSLEHRRRKTLHDVRSGDGS